MTKRLAGVWLGSLVYLAGAPAQGAQAQSAKASEAYSAVYVNSMSGSSVVVSVKRDGPHAVVDQTFPNKPDGTIGGHTRTFFDIDKGQQWDMHTNATPQTCSRSNFNNGSSDNWSDLFGLSAGFLQDLAKLNAKEVGTETINGFATKVMQAESKETGTIKVWVDTTYGLIIRALVAGKPFIDVKILKVSKPSAVSFNLPAVCASAPAPPPPPPTEAQKIAALTGGNPADYANASMSPVSSNSCTVLFRVVQAVTMKPITSGFELAIDTTIDPDHFPQYHTDVTPPHSKFSGGALHSVAAQLRNGEYRLDNAPPNFYMELVFDNLGTSSAAIRRSCGSGPTVLLLVIKNLAQLSDGAEWLWVKSGK